jgi:hypothetical protein
VVVGPSGVATGVSLPLPLPRAVDDEPRLLPGPLPRFCGTTSTRGLGRDGRAADQRLQLDGRS